MEHSDSSRREFLEAARERHVECGVVSEVDPELDDD